MTPRVDTGHLALSGDDLLLLRQAAQALANTGADAATIFLPRWPCPFRLERRKNGFHLRASTVDEAAAYFLGDLREEAQAAGPREAGADR